jgi:hypothetical protein
VPRYLVTTRREERGRAASAVEEVAAAPGVAVVHVHSPDMVTIDASAESAGALRDRLAATHYVEAEVRRGLA